MLMVYVYDPLLYTHAEISGSWDTRSSSDPTTKIQAHDREILAVAFNPAFDHLLLTGSADQASPVQFPLDSYAEVALCRQSSYMTCGRRRRGFTSSSHIQTRSYTSPGRRTTIRSSRLLLATGESTSGTYRKLASSRHQTNKRMAPRNLCSCTAVCLNISCSSCTQADADTEDRTYRSTDRFLLGPWGS